MTVGRCIVVGGHSRGVGKTALVVELVRALDSPRLATVKVSAHRHGGGTATVCEDREPSPHTSTGRCLLAGAQRAFLCRCPDEKLAGAADLVRDLVGDGWDVIVESNRIAPLVAADLTCFVVSGATADWKASSPMCLSRADVIVLSPGTRNVPARARVGTGGLADTRSVFRFAND